MLIKKKKLYLFTSAVILSLVLSSCGFRSEIMSRDDEKIADTRFEKIIEAIKSKDKVGLKKMFSQNALKEAKDIDGGIDYLIKFYKGKLISKDSAREGSDSNDFGERISELDCMYTVTTDADKYIVFFIDKLVDTKNPDNVGLYMLQIIKESDEDKEFDWGGDKTRCVGIYRPTE